jgi:hypothetical protein
VGQVPIARACVRGYHVVQGAEGRGVARKGCGEGQGCIGTGCGRAWHLEGCHDKGRLLLGAVKSAVHLGQSGGKGWCYI